MRIQIGIVLLISMFCAASFGVGYSGGTGELNDPFIIATANDLQQISYESGDWDKCFLMVADIDLAELDRDFDIIAESDDFPFFTGVFDGGGHIISNFKCDACDVEGYHGCIPFGAVGLFYGVHGETAEVKNVGMVNADISNSDGSMKLISILAGEIGGGAKVTNCYAENCQVTNACRVGGLVGTISRNGAKLSNCYTTWDVTTGDYDYDISCVGGLACRADRDAVISNCYTTGNITGSGTVGGLVAWLGEHGSFIIEDCYTTGDVANRGSIGNDWILTSVGGLIGKIGEYVESVDIRRCYSTGTVYGSPNVGGLIGGIKELDECIISDCYASGSVNVIYCQDCDPLDYGDIAAGGLVGKIYHGVGGEMINCHAEGDVNFPLLCVDHGGNDYAGGLIGFIRGRVDCLIKNCNSAGNVSAVCDGQDGPVNEVYTGGLTGYSFCCKMFNNCHATGDVTGYSHTGGLVGCIARTGQVIGCSSTGRVNGGDYTGGLVGCRYVHKLDDNSTADNVMGGNGTNCLLSDNFEQEDIVFNNCYVTGDVNGNNYTGGLVGYNYDSCSYITNCYATGNVEGNDYVGGLIGRARGVYLSYATGNVKGNNYVGGFGGRALEIGNCYSKGDVNGIYYIGGFLGAIGVEINNCYSTGKVVGGDDANSVGGFTGFCRALYSHGITNCFWDIEASKMSVGVGFVEGDLVEPLDIQGEITGQMKASNTFTDAGWDFVDVWGIGQNQSYPYLRQYLAADVSRDGVVDFADFAILADNWLVGR